MNGTGKILLAVAAGLLLLGAGEEVAGIPPAPEIPQGVARVSFRELAAGTLPQDPLAARAGDYRKVLPRAVLGLDGQRVAVEGFMIPTHREDRRVRDFLLVRNQASCCFGLPPRAGEVVEVHMAGTPAESLMDRTVTVVGRLQVQEHWTGGYLESLYQMEGEQVDSRFPARPLNAAPASPAGGIE